MTIEKSLRLHLGCGTNKLPGWVNVDSVKDCQPDLLHDLAKPLAFTDLSVDAILAEGLLEHFDKYMRYAVFSDWVRVLKIGGTITVGVPNFKKIIFRYFKFEFNNFVDTIFGENLWNSKFYIGHFGNHKWGYSKESLADFVKQFGIEPVLIQTKALAITLAGRKTRHLPQEEVEAFMIYSHNNKCGIGVPEVSFGFAKEKISVFESNSK